MNKSCLIVSVLAVLMTLASCVSIVTKNLEDDCFEATLGALEFDCKVLTLEFDGFCFEFKSPPGCPKLKKGLLRIGGDLNGDGELQDDEVSETYKATPGTTTWCLMGGSGSLPAGSQAGLLDIYVEGDNGTTYVDTTEVASV